MKLSRSSLFIKWAGVSDYEEQVEDILSQMNSQHSVSLGSFSEFESFLSGILKKIIHKYIIQNMTMKVCSTISPDFSEIAMNAGFPVAVRHLSGHVVNVLYTTEGPYEIDLSAIQFACKNHNTYEVNTKEEKEGVRDQYRALYADPYKAIKITKLPMQELSGLSVPNSNPEMSPAAAFNDYDIEDTEETFPERFNYLKR